MYTNTRTIILLLTVILILSSTAFSQKDASPPIVISVGPTKSDSKALPTPNTKPLIIIYSDGEQIELTDWLWHYSSSVWIAPEEPKKKKKSILSEIFNPSPPPTLSDDPLGLKKRPVQQISSVSSRNLKLSMEGLSKPGISLDDIELSETQFSSIKFIWKERELDRVIVSLTSGKTIEFPVLKPSIGQELYLEGNTNVNGFSGRFSKILNTRLYSERGTIVEIKVK